MRAVLATALLALSLGGLPTAGVSAAPKLAPGTFLYADPSLLGSVFEASVVVLTHVDSKGTTGLIFNKPTRLTPRNHLGVDGAERLQRPLYLGGPVETDAISALVRLEAGSPDRVVRVLEDIFFVTDPEALARSLREVAPDRRVRVFAGYSGWAPGQLEGEIARGSWVVAPGDADAVFSDEPESLWEEVYRLRDAIEARAPAQPLRSSRITK